MASYFDTLFGGGAERDAANANRAALGDYRQLGTNALDLGVDRATGALTDANRNAGINLDRNYGMYGDLRTAGTGILDRGRADSLAALEGVKGIYDPLQAKYGAGTSLYLDSLGVNGAEGNARAVQNFQAGPGYEFTRDQGIEALNRRRAAAGMLNSGNADIDALKYGTGLANQTYGTWQDRLSGLINPEMTAATGAAGARTNIANTINADTLARLGLEQGVTQGQAGVNTARAANDVALGNSLAGVYSNDATNRTGLYGNVASGNMAANNLEAQGQAQGARNLFNGAISLASLAAGGAGGGGGSFGSLFSGGGGSPGAYNYGGVAVPVFR